MIQTIQEYSFFTDEISDVIKKELLMRNGKMFNTKTADRMKNMAFKPC